MSRLFSYLVLIWIIIFILKLVIINTFRFNFDDPKFFFHILLLLIINLKDHFTIILSFS